MDEEFVEKMEPVTRWMKRCSYAQEPHHGALPGESSQGEVGKCSVFSAVQGVNWVEGSLAVLYPQRRQLVTILTRLEAH